MQAALLSTAEASLLVKDVNSGERRFCLVLQPAPDHGAPGGKMIKDVDNVEAAVNLDA